MDCEAGTDLADIYVNLQNQPQNMELTRDEILIKDIATENPEIYNLIETFGLCDSFDNLLDVQKIKNYICN